MIFGRSTFKKFLLGTCLWGSFDFQDVTSARNFSRCARYYDPMEAAQNLAQERLAKLDMENAQDPVDISIAVSHSTRNDEHRRDCQISIVLW